VSGAAPIGMTLEQFRETLKDSTPPDVSDALRALWYDGRRDWDRAHSVAQDLHTEAGSWVHAYLHRKEGDQGNAAYWYRRAGKPIASGPLEAEWEAIASALLDET
jgi:hypothetical protein